MAQYVLDAMKLLKRYREKGEPFDPLADEVALLFAQRCRYRLSQTLHLPLTWDQWTQLTAILQVEVAVAIRHAAFDPPEFPGDQTGIADL